MKILSVNKIVRGLIGIDLIFMSAFGLIAPVFAIFITEQIKGGDIKVVGFATGIYWLLRAILQVPIGKLLDKLKGEKDDFYALVLGYIIVTIVPFGYILSSLSWHIYFLQIIYSIGMAMAYPAWCGIFTRHVDKGKEAFEWGSYGTIVDLGIGAGGIIGGVMISEFGFNYVFLVVGMLSLISSLLLLTLRKYIVPKNSILSFIQKFHRPF